MSTKHGCGAVGFLDRVHAAAAFEIASPAYGSWVLKGVVYTRLISKAASWGWIAGVGAAASKICISKA